MSSRQEILDAGSRTDVGRPTDQFETLVLGCGGTPELQAVNLDRVALPKVDVVHEMTDAPWPFPDDRFLTVRADHVMEHIPHYVPGSPQDGLIIVMNEVWRVTKPGGTVSLVVPHSSHPRALGDPTHCRYMVDRSWWYFGRPEVCVPGHEDFKPREPAWNWYWYGSDYGIEARFDILMNEVIDGRDLHTVFRKPATDSGNGRE